MKEQARKKMLEEMNKPGVNQVMENLHVWLCNQDNEDLIAGVNKEGRTLLGASMYCYKKGSEIATKFGSMGVANVTLEMEQEFATEYFLAEKINDSDLMKWPVPKGETKTVTVEKEVEVIKEVFVGTPNAEHIQQYIDTQKKEERERKEKTKKDVGAKKVNLSLFDV